MKNLRKLREAVGLTQNELAIRAGISRGYIAQLELGKEPPPELKAKLEEVILAIALRRLRALLPPSKRMDESREVVERLKTIEREKGIHALVRQRTVVFDLDDATAEPFMANGATALHLFSSQHGLVDIVILDDYVLDNLAMTL